MTTPAKPDFNELVRKRARLIVYAVALGGLVVLGAIGRGFAAIDHPSPDWLTFATAAWAYAIAPLGLSVATLSNLIGRSTR